MAEKLKEFERRLDDQANRGKERPPVRLSSGSTLLNLACTDSWRGAFEPGKYYLLVGDSASGKSFLSMTCFAEAVRSKAFKDYKLILDNVEDGCNFDVVRLFGKETQAKIVPPRGTIEEPIYSETVEQFYDSIDSAIREGTPFVYVLDSMDSLTSEASDSLFDLNRRAADRGGVRKQSYGDGKAKINSASLRRVLSGIRRTKSILIIVSQTRDNFGFGFEKKTRSGGHALRFYATLELWSSVAGKIKKDVRGKRRNVGVSVKLAVRKNRVTGKLREVCFGIYPSYGIDDIGSCVDYLVDEKWWKKTGKRILAGSLSIDAPRDELIRLIEQDNKQDALRKEVAKCWAEIEKQSEAERSPRYA